jgi:imidazolonepropionase-like amidohydrolase
MTRTLFSGGRVFDAVSGEARDADLVIEDGRIVDVGAGLDGDHSVDASGRTLLPGLFDCHTHVAYTHIDTMQAIQTPFSLRFYEAEVNLGKTLDLGITTIRDAGGADLGMKEAVERGIIRGPRMQISLTMISQTGGHGDEWMPFGEEVRMFGQAYPGMPSPIVDGPEEMRRKVRELIRNGADVIKVATSGGVLSARDDPRHPHFSPQELEAMVETAAAHGLWVMAHAQGAEGIKNGVRAGIRSIDHGVFMDDEAIALMLDRGAWFVPTLIATQGVIDAADAGAAIPEVSVRKARELIEVHRESFRRAVAAGVKIAMGTDSAVTPHGENLRELILMEEGGQTPSDVIRSSTISAAELMGLQDELGSLEAGKRADVVVVDGDPFDFKTLSERIEAVYKDGISVFNGGGPG